MRKKIISQRKIFDQSIHQLTCLVQHDPLIKRIDEVIDLNSDMVDLVHCDLTATSKNTGKKGISAEQVLRAAVLKQLKQYTWRELAERLNDGITLRWFTRFYAEPIPHYTTLQKAINGIGEGTWEKIKDMLVAFASDRKLEKGESVRMDTTVIETNIAYPTDARLLWDGIRVLTRVMDRIRQRLPELDFGYADRTRKSKKLCYQIVMTKGPGAEKKRRKLYRKLIQVANEVFEMGAGCFHRLNETNFWFKEYDQLDHYLTLMAVAIAQCERRILHNEDVPALEKTVSLFEEHTDIIRRGKSQSPTEFGHKVFFATGKSGLITQYRVLRGNPGDNELLPDFLKKHKNQYGQAPVNLCADRRFFSDDNEVTAYSQGVKKVSICKPGYRCQNRKQIEKEQWFKKLQRFRAGIEGIISGLMRGFGLKRCLWKGWEAFNCYVGLSVVTFNLRKIALLLR